MRKATLALTVLVLATGSRSAMALRTEDSMTSWAAASPSERSGLVDEIMSRPTVATHISRSELLDCLNEAASVGGHEQLPISEIAHACSHPSDLDGRSEGGTGI